MTDQTWEEERESLLQSALKRWMMVVTSFKQTTVVWVQLATESDDLRKLTVLADVFRGKVPGTLLKRVRAVEKICNHLGQGLFPCSEETTYRFFKLGRDNGAPPSRLKSYLEALAFCLYTFSMGGTEASSHEQKVAWMFNSRSSHNRCPGLSFDG